jgi:predicted enzyme related to lactoylglutathione lyase
MIGPIKTVGIYVADQAKSVEFFTGKLGFEVRRSIPMGPDANWIEVSPPGAETSLVLYPKSMMTNWAELKPSVVFHCPDVEETCLQLSAQGVEIKMNPTQLGWGMFATFLDPDGNEFGLTSQELAK